MKRQGTLPELVAELKDENLKKKDFVVPSKCLTMRDGKIVISSEEENKSLMGILKEVGISAQVPTEMVLNCLPLFHENVAMRLDIPFRYYDKMEKLADKYLLDTNVTHWLKDKVATNYFLRTFINKEENEGFARALLSDRYNVIDNFDVLLACLEAVKESGLNLKIDTNGCDLTEKSMYVRFVVPNIEVDAPELLRNYRNPKGDVGEAGNGIITGFVIKNSEVGQGSFTICPRAVILKCSNGMVFKDDNFSKMHLGARMEGYSQINWSEETKRKNFELVICQVKDAIKKFCSEEYLMGRIAKLQEYGKTDLKNPIDTVRNVTKHLSMSEEKEKNILDFFMRGGDFTPLGVSQALTFYAHETNDADEQYEMECLAVDLLPTMETFDKPYVNRSNQTKMAMN